MAASYLLVVDDEPDIRQLVKEILEDEGYEVGTAESGASARVALKLRRPDLVLLDIWMPDVDGISLLKEWAQSGELPYPVIMISGHGTVETAVEATRLGAYDFIEKPLSLAKLLLTVERALEAGQLRREISRLKKQTGAATELIGKSTQMQQTREKALRIAAHDTWLLIYGEPGSGRRCFARFIHAHSARKAGPFIEVGTGAVTRANAAAELFGSDEHELVRYGKLEQANGGTLLLDEISDMDDEMQMRLSSALDNGSFLRLGGSSPVEINARIIASTSTDLTKKVSEGKFRGDLFYHLNVVPFRVPSLRERLEDVPELLAYYVDYFVRGEHLPYRRFTVAAQNRLRHYLWPGNIRELKNLVQRLLILGGAEDIGVEELEGSLSASPVAKEPVVPETSVYDLSLREAREQFERDYLQKKLQACGGSVGELAKIVGMERTNLYRKLRALGIEVKHK